jgi:hypothetical protein
MQDHLENITKYRMYYNDQLKDIGFEAPTPKAGQKGVEYRRKSLQLTVCCHNIVKQIQLIASTLQQAYNLFGCY